MVPGIDLLKGEGMANHPGNRSGALAQRRGDVGDLHAGFPSSKRDLAPGAADAGSARAAADILRIDPALGAGVADELVEVDEGTDPLSGRFAASSPRKRGEG